MAGADAERDGGAPGRVWLEGAAVAAVALVAFGWAVLPSDALVGKDAFFHIEMARLLVERGPFVDVSWLPFTVLGEEGPDHHWLWHVLLAPFTLGATDQAALFVRLKVATVVTASAVPVIVWGVARALRVPWAPLVALLAVAGATAMPGRLVMLRAQNLAVVFVLLAALALLRRRHVALGAIAMAFVLAYHGAVLLAPLVLLHVLHRAVRERVFAWRPAVAALGGGLAGLLASPWYPANVEYLLFHTLYKVADPMALTVGTEWRSVGLAHLVAEAWPVHLALAAALGARLAARLRGTVGRSGPEATLLLLAALGALALYATSWRFVEYYVPLAAVAAGLQARDAELPRLRRPLMRHGVAAVAVALVLAGGGPGLARIRTQAWFVPSKFGHLAEVLKERARPGAMVYNRGWSDFVFLFWHADRFRYVNGLDPNYLAYGDPRRFREWRWIAAVEPDEPNDPAPLIRKRFAARWAVVDRPGGAGLAGRLDRSPHARRVAESRWGWLYRIELRGPSPGEGTARRGGEASSR